MQLVRRPHQPQRTFPAVARHAAFTLIEVVVVISIILTLFSILLVAAGAFLRRSNQLATVAQIQKLIIGLDDYKSMAGEFPPDGIDSEVKNAYGETIMGSACVYYFLSRPIKVNETVGGNVEVKEYGPVVSQFGEKELGPEERLGVRELVDAWQNPLHYDNTEDGEFKPQGGSVHSPEVHEDEHADDPRAGNFIIEGKNAVERIGIQSRGFDLWSHGQQEGKEPQHFPIASWEH